MGPKPWPLADLPVAPADMTVPLSLKRAQGSAPPRGARADVGGRRARGRGRGVGGGGGAAQELLHAGHTSSVQESPSCKGLMTDAAWK